MMKDIIKEILVSEGYFAKMAARLSGGSQPSSSASLLSSAEQHRQQHQHYQGSSRAVAGMYRQPSIPHVNHDRIKADEHRAKLLQQYAKARKEAGLGDCTHKVMVNQANQQYAGKRSYWFGCKLCDKPVVMCTMCDGWPKAAHETYAQRLESPRLLTVLKKPQFMFSQPTEPCFYCGDSGWYLAKAPGVKFNPYIAADMRHLLWSVPRDGTLKPHTSWAGRASTLADEVARQLKTVAKPFVPPVERFVGHVGRAIRDVHDLTEPKPKR